MMDLLKLGKDIKLRMLEELNQDLCAEIIIDTHTVIMEEIKKHLEVKNNGVLDDVSKPVCDFEKGTSCDERSVKLRNGICRNCGGDAYGY